MSHPSLKHKATKGLLWSTLEKLSIRGGQFLIGIILARILSPDDFGMIAMLAIFISISQAFIESGLGRGLIQKQDRTDIDFSTVFVFNFVTSLIIYLILFITAPLIAHFYETPELTNLVRILSTTLILNALIIIQSTKLTINIDFKSLAKINVISVFSGGIFGIIAALTGFGVWSLVIQTVTRTFTSVILFWILGDWKPSLAFSRSSFKSLFGYGSKLLMAGIYAETVNNVYNMVIGKVYLASELGFYSRAKNFTALTADTMSQAILQVTFPILSALQDEKERMVEAYKNVIKMVAFVTFPLMTMLSLLAEPLIRLLLTDKWIMVVPLLQWMAFSRILYPLSAINLNILNATGRSDLFLKVDLSKLPIIILVLIITLPLGVKAMIIGQVVLSFISFFVNAYMPGRMYNYGGLKQLKDLLPHIIATLIMAAAVFFSIHFIDSLYLQLIIGSLVGIASYLGFALLFNIKELKEIKTIIAGLIQK